MKEGPPPLPPSHLVMLTTLESPWYPPSPSVVLRYPESEDACRTSWPSSQPSGAIEPSGSGWKTRGASGGGWSAAAAAAAAAVARTTTTMLRSIVPQQQVALPGYPGCATILLFFEGKPDIYRKS